MIAEVALVDAKDSADDRHSCAVVTQAFQPRHIKVDPGIGGHVVFNFKHGHIRLSTKIGQVAYPCRLVIGGCDSHGVMVIDPLQK
ncbi:hypothetical protein D3C77_635490 [compost metagenome]